MCMGVFKNSVYKISLAFYPHGQIFKSLKRNFWRFPSRVKIMLSCLKLFYCFQPSRKLRVFFVYCIFLKINKFDFFFDFRYVSTYVLSSQSLVVTLISLSFLYNDNGRLASTLPWPGLYSNKWFPLTQHDCTVSFEADVGGLCKHGAKTLLTVNVLH